MRDTHNIVLFLIEKVGDVATTKFRFTLFFGNDYYGLLFFFLTDKGNVFINILLLLSVFFLLHFTVKMSHTGWKLTKPKENTVI